MQTEAINLSTPYTPVAVYYSDADYVEYIRRDVPCFQRRVDEFLTLSHDLYTQKLVGFRIKGFRCLYLNHLKKTQELFDGERFISLVSVIEKAVEVIGDRVFDSEAERKEKLEAYATARQIAREDSAALTDLPDDLAA